jgi:hypothetical protein
MMYWEYRTNKVEIRVDDAQGNFKKHCRLNHMKGIQNNDYLMVDKMNMAASNKLLNSWKSHQRKLFYSSLRK